MSTMRRTLALIVLFTVCIAGRFSAESLKDDAYERFYNRYVGTWQANVAKSRSSTPQSSLTIFNQDIKEPAGLCRMFLDPLLKFGQARFPALLFVSSIEDDPLDAPVDAIQPFEARPTNHFLARTREAVAGIEADPPRWIGPGLRFNGERFHRKSER